MKPTIAPRKRLSQNFLTDGRTAQKIASFLNAAEQDVILEIGPGGGALTEHLLQTKARHIIAVDLDERAVEALQPLIARAGGRLEVRLANVLNLHIHDVFPATPAQQRLVIGNIPYAITSEILFWLFDQRQDLRRAVIMMQREVARRCVARPGSKEYGILSVATWYVSTAAIVATVQPGSFFPRPSVTSAVVRFDVRVQAPTQAPFRPFMEFVRAAFGQRRKVLSNSLEGWARQRGIELTNRTIADGRTIGALRAEQLTPEDLAELYLSLVPENAR